MFFECMRKEVVIGGGDIKEGECMTYRGAVKFDTEATRHVIVATIIDFILLQ